MPAKKMNKKARKNGKVQARGYGPVIQPQQPSLRVILPWSFSSSVGEAVAGAGGIYSLALNNAFDPNFTGVGAQPLSYDQYSALFSRVRVLRVRYAISFAQRTTQPIRVGFFPSAQSTTTSDVNAWVVQNSFTKMAWLGPNTGGNNVIEFTGTFDMPRILGVNPKEFFSDMDFSALISAGPTRTVYCHMFVVGNSGTLATADFTARLWLEAEFTGPVALGLS